ncbi:hypothetical protein AOLI_G00120950 [Acnodon oligacanthus]
MKSKAKVPVLRAPQMVHHSSVALRTRLGTADLSRGGHQKQPTEPMNIPQQTLWYSRKVSLVRRVKKKERGSGKGEREAASAPWVNRLRNLRLKNSRSGVRDNHRIWNSQ